MRIVDLIEKKREKEELTKEEIKFLCQIIRCQRF